MSGGWLLNEHDGGVAIEGGGAVVEGTCVNRSDEGIIAAIFMACACCKGLCVNFRSS